MQDVVKEAANKANIYETIYLSNYGQINQLETTYCPCEFLLLVSYYIKEVLNSAHKG